MLDPHRFRTALSWKRHRPSPTAEPSPLCHPAHVLSVSLRLWIADSRNYDLPLAAMAQVGIALAYDRLSDWDYAIVVWASIGGQG
jgi:hypothetical protein